MGAETLAAPAAFDPIILRTLDDLRLTDLLLWRTLGIRTSAPYAGKSCDWFDRLATHLSDSCTVPAFGSNPLSLIR
ncbi:MAG TPA: hypothetical protein PKL52_03030 [Tenuifilaceae bacterium]|nr:hypothetical protein [Tenuifilaceae bacterium]